MHMQAFIIVIIIKISVMTAKNVSDLRAGLYWSSFGGVYIRTNLKRKYAMAAK